MKQFELLVRRGAVVSSDDVIIADVAVSAGEIVGVSPEIVGSAREEIDARGLHVLPGAVEPLLPFGLIRSEVDHVAREQLKPDTRRLHAALEDAPRR